MILSPITALHGLVLIIRHALFDIGLLKSQYADIPTLVIGNIHAGGTGKTPHASSLLSIFAKRLGGAENVALLSRGYGRKSQGFRCCLLYTSPSPRDLSTSRMPSSA